MVATTPRIEVQTTHVAGAIKLAKRAVPYIYMPLNERLHGIRSNDIRIAERMAEICAEFPGIGRAFVHTNSISLNEAREQIANSTSLLITIAHMPSTEMGIIMGISNLFKIPLICFRPRQNKENPRAFEHCVIETGTFVDYSLWEGLPDLLREELQKIINAEGKIPLSIV